MRMKTDHHTHTNIRGTLLIGMPKTTKVPFWKTFAMYDLDSTVEDLVRGARFVRRQAKFARDYEVVDKMDKIIERASKMEKELTTMADTVFDEARRMDAKSDDPPPVRL